MKNKSLFTFASMVLVISLGWSDFTLGVIPDTQFLSESDGGRENIKEMHRFFIDRKEELNVKFVVSLGDMTQDYTDNNEWERVREAYDVIESSEIPYAPNQGCHDDIGYINQYFPLSYFESTPEWGGNMEGKGIEDAYYYFSGDGMDFILIVVEEGIPKQGTPAAVRNWASDVFEEHPERRGILAAHNIQPGGGEQNTIVAPNDNVFMAVAGHDCRDGGEDHWTSTSPNGMTQNLMLSDYQCRGDNNRGATVRYYTFKPDEDEICAFTYNIVQDAYETDGSSQFCFDYEMTDTPTPVLHAGSVNHGKIIHKRTSRGGLVSGRDGDGPMLLMNIHGKIMGKNLNTGFSDWDSRDLAAGRYFSVPATEKIRSLSKQD